MIILNRRLILSALLWLPSSFRWGYGWPYPRFYRQLSEREQRQVNIHLDGLMQQADIIKK
jgi:hypothetical protein